MTLTANAVLKGKEDSFSVFHGSDYTAEGRKSATMSDIHYVWSMSDVGDIPVRLDRDDFENIFNRIFSTSDVSVHSLASLVYIIRKPLENYQADKKSKGRSHILLF